MSLVAGTKVLTPLGWRKLRAVRQRDVLLTASGSWQRVESTVQRSEDVYRVVFSDGVSVECGLSQLWPVRTKMDTWRGKGFRVLSLESILARGLTMGKGLRWWVPQASPLPQVGAEPLPLHPYLLGVYLGDGSSRSSNGTPNITNVDHYILAKAGSLLPKGVALQVTSRPHSYNISQGKGAQTVNPVLAALRRLHLDGLKSEHKIIPEPYLMAAPSDRLWLLKGLCDTDGSPAGEEGDTFVEYSTSSPRLAHGVRYLVESLGGTAKTKSRIPFYTHNGERKSGLTSYRISVKLPRPLNPFATPFKSQLYTAPTKYPPRRAIAAVEPRGRQRVIELKLKEERTYIAEGCLVVHVDGDHEPTRYAGAERLQILTSWPKELLV